MKADLHMHSVASDGSDSIDQLIDQAIRKDLDLIAITDHDTIDHLAYIPSDANIHVIGGVEVSAIHHETNTKAHILGYRIGKPEIVSACTQALLEARSSNSEKQANILMQMGYRIDMSRLARAGGKYLYKQHIMDWLVATGQVPDMFGDFYQQTFKSGGPCDFDIAYIDVFEAVRAIKTAGGLAVLAHPGQQQNFCLIPELVRVGIDGLELNHYANNDKDRETIRRYADQYGLFLTGGSDYHGKYESYATSVGDYLSEDSGLQAILQSPR